MTICKETVMVAGVILMCATLATGCAAPEAAAAATNSPPPAAAALAEVNVGETRANTSNSTEILNAGCVKIVYPDDTSEDFSVDDWAEELAAKAEQGVHVKNGYALVLVRLEPIEGEFQSLTKLRAKFRAIEILRNCYQDLPKDFSAPCRVLVCDQSETDGQCVVVMAFLIKDLKAMPNPVDLSPHSNIEAKSDSTENCRKWTPIQCSDPA